MKVGVIGAGFIASQHLRAWQHLGVDLAIYGGSGAHALGEEFGVEVVDSVEALLDIVDIVDICTPTDTHASYALSAAEAGRHVICEKPLALTAAGATRVVDTCESAGVRLFVSHVVRYFTEYEVARKAVEAGAVGDLAVIRLARESFPPERSDSHWLFDEQRSGGVIGDLMSHDIDYAISLAGPVTRVFARTMRAASSVIDDHAYVVLTHASGALSHLTASWAQIAPRFRTRIDIAGASGLLTFDSDVAQVLDVGLRTGSSGADLEVGLPGGALSLSDNNPFVRQFRDFLDAISGQTAARVNPKDAVDVAAVIAAALESASTRCAVSIQ